MPLLLTVGRENDRERSIPVALLFAEPNEEVDDLQAPNSESSLDLIATKAIETARKNSKRKKKEKATTVRKRGESDV